MSPSARPTKMPTTTLHCACAGESMKCAGILDGDLVIARKVSTAEDGEMVVALIEDEATVKYLYREPNRIRLQPDNPEYDPSMRQTSP